MDKTSLLSIKNYAINEFRPLKDTQHNLHHMENVTKKALVAAQKYDLDLSLMEVICYLHDFTYTRYKPTLKTYIFEGRLIESILNNLLSEFDITDEEKEIIITACKKHPYSFPFRKLNKNADLYTKILQDADTLDFFEEERVGRFFNRHTRLLLPIQRLLRVIRKRFINFFLNLPYSTYETN